MSKNCLLIISTPGMGKTTFVKSFRGQKETLAIDLDYKTSSKKIGHKDIEVAHSMLINAWKAAGADYVTSFNGWFDPVVLDDDIHILYVIPSKESIPSRLADIEQRDCRSGGRFIDEAKENYAKWVEALENAANKYLTYFGPERVSIVYAMSKQYISDLMAEFN